MKTVVVKPEFAGLTEEQVIDAIDAYEAQVDEYYANKGDEEECGCGCSHDEGSCEDSDDDVIPSDDPIVLEVERLIAAYSDRFDELCKENGEVPEEALTYKPRTPIEQVAFDIFTRCPARLPHGRRRRVKRRKGPQTRSFFHQGPSPGGNSPKPFRNRDRLQKPRLRRRPPPKHQDICCLSFRIRLHDASSSGHGKGFRPRRPGR
ncbi:MAG: hypothetical protein ACLSAH_04565 [Bilophila wadsworthia]